MGQCDSWRIITLPHYHIVSLPHYHIVTLAHYHIQNTQAHHAPALAELQHTVFPTLSDSERMAAPHYLRHIELFPEGQIVVLDGERVVASSSSIRHSFPQENHRFLDVSGQLWLDTHQPDGDWLYGMDLGVHPDYRGRGIARAIYQARHDLCHRLGLRGQVIVGMLNGYAAFSEKMSVVEYFDRLMRHELSDPTISAQVRIGFEPLRLMPDYLDDPQCGNAGVLMRWKMMNDESHNTAAFGGDLNQEPATNNR